MRTMVLTALAWFLPAAASADASVIVPPQQSSHIEFHISPITKPYHYTVSWQVINDDCIDAPVLFCNYRKLDSKKVWQDVPGFDLSNTHPSDACEMDAPTDVGDYRLYAANITKTCNLRITYSILPHG